MAYDPKTSLVPGARLTEKQEAFAVEFVANRGNGTQAAIVAGFASPAADAMRILTKPHVAQRIRQLSAHKALESVPAALAVLSEIMLDPEQMAKDRVAAAKEILGCAGVVEVKDQKQLGPTMALQVNVNSGDKSGQAQALIKEIWTSRKARDEAKSLSDMSGQDGGHDAGDVIALQD